MSKIRLKNVQKAQGMVEFALVLPILLLVILGVFAFGHLFFVYSSVVSASREAARWGAAVGQAPSSAPRYQDCTSIRAAAVRVGGFAGVGPNTVTINYDHGPVNPPNAPVIFANCPLAGTGPDATQVRRGDRIVVRVTVQYTPIVPFVNLPSFPLTAETGRTIVKSLPVGDAPVAEDPCVTPTHVRITPNPTQSVTGQAVFYGIEVVADDGTTPTGSVTYSDSDGNTFGPTVLSGGQASFTVAYQTVGDKQVSIRYESDNECHMGSAEPDHWHTVNPASTSLRIIDPNDPSGRGRPFYVTVEVSVVWPGAATTLGPSGQVNISIDGGTSCTANVDLVLRTAMCPITPNQLGIRNISATYVGDSNYKSFGPVTDPHNVLPPETATFLPSPTTALPTATSAPFCPYFESDVLSLSTPPTSFTISVRNRDVYDLKISRVKVSWPTSGQTARLDEIRFTDAASIDQECKNNDSAQCVWYAKNSNDALLNDNPLAVSNPPPAGTWSSNNAGISRGASRLLRLLFTTDLALQGPYYLEVEFMNSQGQRCTTNPVINYTR